MSFFRKWVYYLKSIYTLIFSIENFVEVIKIFIGKPIEGLKWLHLRRDGLKIAVRGKMEVWSVKETLMDRFYTRYGCEIKPDWVIVDIGAAIGEFTIESALQAHQGTVYAFEPNPGSLNVLRQNLRANKITNVEAFNLGVWNSSGEIALKITNDEPLQAQSLHPDQQVDPLEKQTSIPVATLYEILNDYVKRPVNLLKLDCEGAEYEILLGAEVEALNLVERIVMEYHDIGPTKNHLLLENFLKENGFIVRMHPNPVHAYLGYLFAVKEHIGM